MRQKTVFKPNDLIYRFCNNLSVAFDKTPGGKLFVASYRGANNVMYHYGTHYMASRFDLGVQFINSYIYSNTTAKVLSKLRVASKDDKYIEIPDLFDLDSKENLEYLSDEITDEYIDALNCSVNFSHQRFIKLSGDLKYLLNTYHSEATRSLYLTNLAEIEDMVIQLIPSIIEKSQKLSEAQAERQRKNDLLDAQDYLNDLVLWRANKKKDLYRTSSLFTSVPVKVEGNKVISALGVEMPIPLVRAFVSKWENLELENGQKLGEYTLDKWTADWCKIGCHEFYLNDIKLELKEILS